MWGNKPSFGSLGIPEGHDEGRRRAISSTNENEVPKIFRVGVSGSATASSNKPTAKFLSFDKLAVWRGKKYSIGFLTPGTPLAADGSGWAEVYNWDRCLRVQVTERPQLWD